MNETLKLSLEEYCLNKKNISTILQNSLLFMDLKQEKVVAPPLKNKKQYKKIHDKDTLFWILYIFENSFDSYEMIGRDKYSVEMKHKTKYVNDNYPKLLEQYSASIAATTFNPNIKYWENSAAGCLTFMEISDKNRGKYLGYVDGESAIFINETNYLDKFHEYLNDKENPKSKEIARKGREYSLR